MFLIKRVGDKRLAQRICGSFNIDSPEAIVYGAFKDDQVLATAVFLNQEDTVVLIDVDTGRRLDIDLIDGMARAAFSTGVRAGMKQGQLGERVSQDLRIALTKLGYEAKEPFILSEFFAKKNCKH